MDVVRKIENTETLAGDRPKADVVIAASGHIPVETAFSVEKSDAQSDHTFFSDIIFL